MTLRTCCTGFDYGVMPLPAGGNAGNKPFDVVTGAPTFSTTNPRTGTGCLNIVTAASLIALSWGTDTIGASQTFGRCVFGIRANSAFGSGSHIMANWQGAFNAEFVFNNATGKMAVRFEGEALVDGPTMALSTYYEIEMYVSVGTAGAKFIDWWVDGVAQTQCVSTGGADSFARFEIGASFGTGTSYDLTFDDVVVWADNAAIAGPKGPHKVILLPVDPAGTLTITGTTGNFNTFTANGTLAAWNAATARGAIDEIPPVLGATADGIVQITLLTTDCVNIPMATYTLAAGESIAALRMLACGWATSTTAATLGFRSFNGTTETILQAGTVDPGFDNTNSATGWVCKMCTLAEFDTQAELDALVFRVGFSSDATPDIGIHAIFGEVAIQEAVAATVVRGRRARTPVSVPARATRPGYFP